MVKSYKILSDIATADVAFEAKGSNLSDIFEICAEAVFDVMVKRDGVEGKIEKKIELKNKELNGLLFDFLNEILYLKDLEAMIFCCSEVVVCENEGIYVLKAKIIGDKIDVKKHELGVDVKAVTMHKFSLEKKGDEYIAMVILDV